jgi:intraflagellar transport protein 74
MMIEPGMQKFEENRKKYEALHQRDQKMQDFFRGFVDATKEYTDRKEQLQHNIVALLQHISKQVVQGENLPDSQKFGQLQNDLSFKERNLENSQSTLDMIRQDLTKRKDELLQIESLDEKIRVELVKMTEDMKRMEGEIIQFEKVDELAKQAAQTKVYLDQQLVSLRSQHAVMSTYMQTVGAGLDAEKQVSHMMT